MGASLNKELRHRKCAVRCRQFRHIEEMTKLITSRGFTVRQNCRHQLSNVLERITYDMVVTSQTLLVNYENPGYKNQSRGTCEKIVPPWS